LFNFSLVAPVAWSFIGARNASLFTTTARRTALGELLMNVKQIAGLTLNNEGKHHVY
jgi:hypothetical protein